jgi:hypothetical protein
MKDKTCKHMQKVAGKILGLEAYHYAWKLISSSINNISWTSREKLELKKA